MRQDIRRILIIFTTAVTFAWNTSAGTPEELWYYCHGDYCNVDALTEPTDFCSEEFEKCRPCTDVLDDCFTPNIPTNCSGVCIKYEVEKQIKEAKEKPCVALKPIPNGNLNGSLIEYHNQGDLIAYTCNSGYRLKGARNIKCKEYGEWSSDTPTCEEILCPFLRDVANGKHNGSVSSLKPGDTVITSCAYGHQLYGKSITVCNNNGFWTNTLPVCEKITCPKPHPIRHGQWHYRGKYLPGDTVTATCDTGFLMDGSVLWNCTHDGNWESIIGSFMPVCLLEGESSETLSCNTWILILVLGAILLLLSISTNVVLLFIYCGGRCKRYGRVKHDELRRDKKGSEEEQKQLLEFEERISVKNETVSLRDQKQTKERIIPPGADLPPAHSPSVGYQKEKPLASSKSKDIQEETEAGIFVNIYNNNNNTNTNNSTLTNGLNENSTDQQLQQQPPPPDSGTQEPLKSKKGQVDNTPVEETGTFQPKQPESPDSNTDVKLVEGSQTTFPEGASIDESSLSELYPSLAVQQAVNNEQDIARKVALPHIQINTDDKTV